MLHGEHNQEQSIPLDFGQLSGRSSVEEVGAYVLFVSQHYAEQGLPAIPSNNVIRRASQDGVGPGTHVICSVLGSIEAAEEYAGFVMPGTHAKWDRSAFIENGIWMSHCLGSSEHPIMPRYPDIERFSKYKLVPPLERIQQEFGSVLQYQDALGFVTRATLERWTDKDWIDNGIWLSHMLGSPDAPVMPTQASIKRAARLKIMPPLGQIEARYGSLANYQGEIGFDVKRPELDYGAWDRNTFVDNGIWLSHMLGSPDAPVMPTQSLINQASDIGLCPPVTALVKRFKRSLTDYQDALGFVTRATLERWTDKDWIDNGIWLSHMLGSPDAPVMPTEDSFAVGSVHNISPNADQIRERFGISVIEFQEMLGFINPNAFKFWGVRDCLIHARTILQTTGELSRNSIHVAEGPSTKAYQRRFGSLAALRERFGIVDYASWTESDYLNFCVQYMNEHDGRVPQPKDIKRLRSEASGPAYTSFQKVMGSSEEYAELCEKAYQDYCNIREALKSENRVSDDVLTFVLREYSADPGYIGMCQKNLETIKSLANRGVKFSAVREMFKNSRITLDWLPEDFLYFGSHLFGKKDITMTEARGYLQTLDEMGLSPFLDELAELFGTIDEFLERSKVYGQQCDEK